MSTWLLIFVCSGSALVLFVLLKMFQIRFGILLFWPSIRSDIEVKLQQRKVKIVTWFSRFSSRNFYIFLHKIVLKLKSWVVLCHGWLDRKSHRLTNLIRGRQHVEMSTKASHFLNDVRSFRDRFRKL